MDTFAAAWEGWEQFEGRASERTWLLRIVLYKWRRYVTALRPVFPLEEEISSPPEYLDSAIVLSDAIDSLPDEQREAFILVRVEGLKYREAAEVLECPIGTVQSRVFDASSTLRRRLGTTFERGDRDDAM